ncbi:hypothetical protein EMWEY_00036800 [Eimeria maxima]|uniref:Uncharacterized protein n=1 Tax=Eimeria maxima TaxID=5804 RepID=U6M9U3_EIMMA|nr:hypothetical protein EMWEY_00036800 [Eimeria maxima]CDJ60982.1 hypothetical protein EMWEY_00036800 [Eimeria maxima]
MGFSPTALRGPVEASVNPVGVETPLSAEHCCDDGPLVTRPLHRSKPFWPPYFRVLALTFASLAVLYWVLRCFDRLRSGRKSAGTSRALADVNETACLGDHGTDTDKEGGESEDGGFPGPSHEAPHTLPSELPAAQGMETAAANEASAHLLQEWSGADGDAFWQWYPETAGGASAGEPFLQWTQHPQELQLDPLHAGGIYFPPGDLHQSMYEPPGLSAHPLSQESATQEPYMSMAPYTDTSYPYSKELSDQEAVLLPVAYLEGPRYQTPHNAMESAQLQFSQGGLRTHQDGDSTSSGEAPEGGSAQKQRFNVGETREDWEGRGLPPPARQQIVNLLDWMHRNACMCNSVLPFLSTDQGARLALITLKMLTLDLGVLSLLPEDLEPVRQSVGDALLELVESTTSYKGKGQEENYIKEVSRMAPLIRQIMLPRHEDRVLDPEKRRARTLTMTGLIRKTNQYLAKILWEISRFAESSPLEDLTKAVGQCIKVLNGLWEVHRKYVNLDRVHRRHIVTCQGDTNTWVLLSRQEIHTDGKDIFPPFEKIIQEFEQATLSAGGIPRIAASVSETAGDSANTATDYLAWWPFIPPSTENSHLGVPTSPQQSHMTSPTDQYPHPSSTEPITQALSPEGWLDDQTPPGW